MSDQFSANESIIGYSHQSRYALLMLLEAPEDTELFIERLDDIHTRQGDIVTLSQIKHHISKQASLSDSSEDLWGTIRIWSTHIKNKVISVDNTILNLVTTSQAKPDSIAAMLRKDDKRDVEKAHEKLLTVIQTSKNKALQVAFKAFSQDLTGQQQRQLVESIYILDESPTIIDVSDKIKRNLRYTVDMQYLESVYERLLGWWDDKKMLPSLLKQTKLPVLWGDLSSKIIEISQQFVQDNLPIDFRGKHPDNVRDYDNRLFVLQLKEIGVSNQRVEKAISDYYQAFEQRSKWAREKLLVNNEMEKYEDRLVDEWERFYLDLIEEDELNFDTLNESELKKIGWKVFIWMDREADIRIRDKVTEPYVKRGNFHILADELREKLGKLQPRVWWHPKFIERLDVVLQRVNYAPLGTKTI